MGFQGALGSPLWSLRAGSENSTMDRLANTLRNTSRSLVGCIKKPGGLATLCLVLTAGESIRLKLLHPFCDLLSDRA